MKGRERMIVKDRGYFYKVMKVFDGGNLLLVKKFKQANGCPLMFFENSRCQMMLKNEVELVGSM